MDTYAADTSSDLQHYFVDPTPVHHHHTADTQSDHHHYAVDDSQDEMEEETNPDEPVAIFDLREGSTKEDLEANGISFEVGQKVKIILGESMQGYGWEVNEEAAGSVFDVKVTNMNGISKHSYVGYSSGKFAILTALEEGMANFESAVKAHPLLQYYKQDSTMESCTIEVTVTAATTPDENEMMDTDPDDMTTPDADADADED